MTSPIISPLDTPGFLAQPLNTESGTNAPLFANPGTQLATAPAVTQAGVLSGILGGIIGTGGGASSSSSVPTFAQYAVIALLAVVLIGVGAVVLLKD